MIEPFSTVVRFWKDAGPKKWFAKSDAFDQEITARFLATIQAARRGACTAWEQTAEGALGLIIVLDQFPRNVFRDTAEMFASDAEALAVAIRAIDTGHDAAVDADLRPFIYMPFMHAEDMEMQNRCVALFEAHGVAENLRFAHIHADAIRRFGRFPHRNAILGRASTPEEIAYLEDGGFSG
ncbi:MAG: DUF924 family protein [Pseudomonadota bacterium]